MKCPSDVCTVLGRGTDAEPSAQVEVYHTAQIASHRLTGGFFVWSGDIGLTLKRRGQRLTPSGLFHLMGRLRERTKIAHLQAHTFRRTFALWSLRAGMSIYHLQRLMGGMRTSKYCSGTWG